MILQQYRRYGRQQPVQKQNQHQQHSSVRRQCPSALQYIGNIFLLGLATLTSELIDLRAGDALETLLAPFQCETGENLEQDILAASVGGVAGEDFLLDLAAENDFTEF